MPKAGEDLPCSSAQSLAKTLDYHERSKHKLERYAAGPEALDWDAQPNPFREFTDTPRIQLSLRADQLNTSFDKLHEPNAISPQPFTLDNIAALLELSFGLSAWKEYGPDRWAVRCNPSSGNLHPTEAYIVCRKIPELEDGVYHYLSRDHLLEQRCKIAKTSGTSARLLVGLSSIIWREAWKYGERAFRYVQLDTGHAIGALRYAAAMLGWQLHIVDNSQQQVAQWLGLDRDEDFTGAEREEAELLMEISCGEAIDPAAVSDIFEASQTHWYGRANILDAHPMYRWPVIDEVTIASRKLSTSRASAQPSETYPVFKRVSETINVRINKKTPLEPNPSRPPLVRASTTWIACLTHSRGGAGFALPLTRGSWRGFDSKEQFKIKAATLIRQRRSAQRFDAKFMQDAASLYRMLDALLPRDTAPWDIWHEASRVHPVLFIHRVTGLEPGIYALPRSKNAQLQMQAAMRTDFIWRKPESCPEHLPLFLLAETSLGKAAKIMNCHQAIAGDSTFMLTMLAEFAAPLKDAAWRYRQLYWEAGLLGQVLYLEAEAAGLRGTGIGCFFDDMCHELLGLRDKTFQSLYHFTVGYPLLDERIAHLPPYPLILSRS